MEEDGGCSQIPGSKVIPVLLAKGERTRARVSGAEISFKRLTLEGRLESVQRLGMMYRSGLRKGNLTQRAHPHMHAPTAS